MTGRNSGIGFPFKHKPAFAKKRTLGTRPNEVNGGFSGNARHRHHDRCVGPHGLHELEVSDPGKKPEALICGYPVYDASAPLARKKGREVSNLWVKINGLSGAVKDSLCGFRVYPLSAMVKLFDARMGLRMDFDVEVLVRLLWLDTPVINRPVGVTYPADGISHFHAFADNVRISCVHTRLFFGMLVRLPELLRRKNV